MVRHHLKLSDVHHHRHHTTSSSSTPSTSSSSSSFSPLSIRLPTTNLLHPLISETSTHAVAVSDRIPGFRTSAAFLTSLRANLHLSSDLFDPTYDSCLYPSTSSFINSPDFDLIAMASETDSVVPITSPEDEELETIPKDPLADIPPLTSYTATTQEDLVEAIHLIADSVAQQRQFAARQLIFHPLIVAVWIALLAMIAQYLYKGRSGDLLLVGTTWTGVISSVLVAIRMITGPYLEMAESIGTWKWLGKDADVIVTKFGDEMIGVVVAQTTKSDSNTISSGTSTGSSPSSKGSQRQRKSNSSNKLRCLIRAWTVKRRYRGKGIGTGLLEEVVKLSKSKGVTPGFGAIEFADDHANAGRAFGEEGFLSYFRFNAAMDRREKKAREMLENVVEDGMSDKEKRRNLKENKRRSS